MTDLFSDDRKGATFDDDREYRYTLWRTWDASKGVVAFIMLNPSTADETKLDPTLRRCKAFAETWGYGGIEIGNLFALRATNPDHLYEHPDPVGPMNDAYLDDIVNDADLVVASWGTHGDLMNRARDVSQRLAQKADLTCLDTTNDGHPVHPLYQPGDRRPRPWPGYPTTPHPDAGGDQP